MATKVLTYDEVISRWDFQTGFRVVNNSGVQPGKRYMVIGHESDMFDVGTTLILWEL